MQLRVTSCEKSLDLITSTAASLPLPLQHFFPWGFRATECENPQSSLTLKILTSTLHSLLVEPCIERRCFTAREHFVRNLRLHFHLSYNATTLCQHLNPPCFSELGTTLLKTRYFQVQFITIHLSQSPVLWSFAKLLLKWASVGLSAVVPLQKEELDMHTHPLQQDSSLRERHPGQHLAGTEPLLSHANRTWERRVTTTPCSSATACFSNRRWNFQEVTLQTTSFVSIHRRNVNLVCRFWHESNPTKSTIQPTPHVQPILWKHTWSQLPSRHFC